MNNKDIKNRIYNLFDEQVPDEFAEILSKSKIKERNYYMEKKTKNQGWIYMFFKETIWLILLLNLMLILVLN